ncbi:MAG: hypothetical protein ACJ8EL_10645 [Rhizomicrobium sp.]
MEQRAYNIRSLLVFGLLLTWPTLAAATPCYDVSRGQPAGLTGTLDYVVLAGPPHYENVQKGNTSEPSFVLRLAHPICVQGSKSADPKTSLQAVQLVKTAKVQGKLKPLLHRQITVTLKNPAPETVHPQAPLFAWVTGVAPATPQVESTKERVPALTTHQVEVAKVDRTAATPHQMKVAKAHEPAAAPHQMKVAKAGTAASTHQVALTEERVAVPTAHRMKVAKARGTAATTHQTKVAKAHGTAATTHQVALTEERVPVPTTHQMKIAKAHGTAATTHRMKFAKGSGTAATTHQEDLAEEHDTAGTTHQVEFTDDQEPDDIADQMEIAEEHGSGAKTVRAFYTRLGDGRGDIASAMVVPRKRAHGPFSADELSRFYGHLQHPIRLEDVETNGPGEFLVHYRYAGSTWGCNGRALVKTVARSGRSYIKSINALDGC